MSGTAVIDIPCVSQTSIWKGFFEAHFMSGKEILEKYPITNKKWKYSPHRYQTDSINYDGYYFAYEKDNIGTKIMFDPWFREFKSYIPIKDVYYGLEHYFLYHTTVESNGVLLKLYRRN